MEPEFPPPQESKERVSDELFSRSRMTVVFLLFAAELGLFFVGLLVPIDQVTQQNLVNETNSQFAWVNTAPPVQVVFLIFGHNVSIALVEMVPILGALLFGYSIYTTGLVAQAILVSKHVPGAFGVILLLFPYSLVELSAYAVAVGSGLMLLVSWRRRRVRREVKVFLAEGVAVASLLVIAATMEELTNLSPAIGFALWLPTGLAIAALAVIGTRRH